ncbi:MAG: molybdate ABC transporter substrate-binding protein [Nitrospirae bacterium]|nr:molybdate ABC transporter substrate-binding protein [Nitrospirota bacterium]
MIKKLFLINIFLLLFFSASVSFSETLHVAAASDLQFAFKEIGVLYKQRTGNNVIFTFGSSGLLSKQIMHGAPFDIFASANKRYVEDLKNRGLIADDKYYIFCRGRLAIVVNKNSGNLPVSINDLINGSFKKIAIANPEHAPYGTAAKEALIKAGIWDDLKPRLIYGENIRQALQYIHTGDADAGIVALSLIVAADNNYLIIEESLHNAIEQSIAVLKDSRNRRLAEGFMDIVLNGTGREILKKYSFIIMGEF